jgi:hypothetical protein
MELLIAILILSIIIIIWLIVQYYESRIFACRLKFGTLVQICAKCLKKEIPVITEAQNLKPETVLVAPAYPDTPVITTADGVLPDVNITFPVQTLAPWSYVRLPRTPWRGGWGGGWRGGRGWGGHRGGRRH